MGRKGRGNWKSSDVLEAEALKRYGVEKKSEPQRTQRAQRERNVMRGVGAGTPDN